LSKAPKAVFFCNSARIPEISLDLAKQPNYLKDLDIPGEKLSYGDLTLKFLVDENLENYMSIHNWLTGLGYPETTEQYKNLTTNDFGQQDIKENFSDGTLTILNSNYQEVAKVKFKDLFPISITSLEFDATMNDIQYFTSEVSFKYTVYNILDKNNKPL
jgi:hypothetical protein